MSDERIGGATTAERVVLFVILALIGGEAAYLLTVCLWLRWAATAGG